MSSSLLHRRLLPLTMASMLMLICCGCGDTVTSPPVPKSAEGYKALVEDRTFHVCGNARIEQDWAARVQLRSDGRCTILEAARLRTSCECCLAFMAAFTEAGEGWWTVEELGGRFQLVIQKADRTPWARGDLIYRQETDLPPMDVEAVRFQVSWEVSTAAGGRTAPTAMESLGRESPHRGNG